MRRMCWLLISMALLLLTTGAMAQASGSLDQESVISAGFEVTGNAKQFKPETWKKKGKVKLADSVVRWVGFWDSGRAIDPKYMNQATMQLIFDEILDGEIIIKTLNEQIELGWNYIESGIDVKGIGLNCYTGYNKKRDHREHTDLSLVCVDAEKYQVNDIVRVSAQSYTVDWTNSGGVYIRSKPLYDLVVAMCAQTYTVEDLKKAQKVDWSDYETGTSTGDTQIIGQLVDVLISGEVIAEQIDLDELSQIVEFIFTMPDGRSFSTKLVCPRPRDDGERQYFLYTANGMYRSDLNDVNNVILAAGLREIRDIFR